MPSAIVGVNRPSRKLSSYPVPAQNSREKRGSGSRLVGAFARGLPVHLDNVCAEGLLGNMRTQKMPHIQ